MIGTQDPSRVGYKDAFLFSFLGQRSREAITPFLVRPKGDKASYQLWKWWEDWEGTSQVGRRDKEMCRGPGAHGTPRPKVWGPSTGGSSAADLQHGHIS